MEKMTKCPICGTKNEKVYCADDMRLVEYYYTCKCCGYGVGYGVAIAEVNWFDEIKEARNRRTSNGEVHGKEKDNEL